MKAHETSIRAQRGLPLQQIGITDSDTIRVFEGQQANLLNLGPLLRLPVEVGDAQQGDDGTLSFMVGYSEIGGPDPIT